MPRLALQKADVVRLIKEDDPETITLAIGDGANDVSMIREAHIGVGLYGNEGMQAVNSSDFALGEFKMLWRLLLVHGRLFYLRNAEMMLYFFYKNVVLTMAHFFFAWSNGLSGQTIYDDFYISCYNLFYTSFPVMVKAVLEQDVNYLMDGGELRKFYPQMYYMGAQKTVYNWTNYLKHNLLAFLDSLVVYFVPVAVFAESDILNGSGVNVDLWSLSLTSFTGVFISVTIRICAWTRWWTCTSFLFYSVFSVLVYIAYIWISEWIDLT
jgi:magnesium-transporting ATPase (P-type)